MKTEQEIFQMYMDVEDLWNETGDEKYSIQMTVLKWVLDAKFESYQDLVPQSIKDICAEMGVKLSMNMKDIEKTLKEIKNDL